MIILDTNVVSEIMLPKPDERVTRWLDQQPRTSIWTTSVTVFEIRFGLETMPDGKRRAALMASFERWLGEATMRPRQGVLRSWLRIDKEEAAPENSATP